MYRIEDEHKEFCWQRAADFTLMHRTLNDYLVLARDPHITDDEAQTAEEARECYEFYLSRWFNTWGLKVCFKAHRGHDIDGNLRTGDLYPRYSIPPHDMGKYGTGEQSFAPLGGVFAANDQKAESIEQLHSLQSANTPVTENWPDKHHRFATNAVTKMFPVLNEDQHKDLCDPRNLIDRAMPIHCVQSMRRVLRNGTIRNVTSNLNVGHYGAYLMGRYMMERTEWLGPLMHGPPAVESWRWRRTPHPALKPKDLHYRIYDPILWANGTRVATENYVIARPANALTEMRLDRVCLFDDFNDAKQMAKHLRHLFLKDAFLWFLRNRRTVIAWGAQAGIDHRALTTNMGGTLTTSQVMPEPFKKLFSATRQAVIGSMSSDLRGTVFDAYSSATAVHFQPNSIWNEDPEWSLVALARIANKEDIAGKVPLYQPELIMPWTDEDTPELNPADPKTFWKHKSRATLTADDSRFFPDRTEEEAA